MCFGFMRLPSNLQNNSILVTKKGTRKMKRIIVFVVAFTATLFIGWVAGTDLDRRSLDLAVLLMLSSISGMVAVICPFLDN